MNTLPNHLRDAPRRHLTSSLWKLPDLLSRSVLEYVRQAPASSYSIEGSQLAGTAQVHDFLLILWTKRRPSTWPSRLEMESSILGELQRKLKKAGGIVNMAYDPEPGRKEASNEDWVNTSLPFRGTLYMKNMPKSLNIPNATVGAVMEHILNPPVVSQVSATSNDATDGDPKDFYICTHGARDCRCGDIGWEFAQRLQEEISLLPSTVQFDATGAPKFRVREIGHVGGHKFAANVMVYPQGEWYGNLRPADVPKFLQAQIQTPTEYSKAPLFDKWKHWRGRMGLSQEAQLALHQEHAKTLESPKAVHDPVGVSAARVIKFVTWEGKEYEVEARDGDNLMELAKKHELSGIEGICEGKLECATCHCFLQPDAANPQPPPVPPPSEAEEDMLDYAIGRKENSRLGCQIRVTPELDKWRREGGKIVLPRF